MENMLTRRVAACSVFCFTDADCIVWLDRQRRRCSSVGIELTSNQTLVQRVFYDDLKISVLHQASTKAN